MKALICALFLALLAAAQAEATTTCRAVSGNATNIQNVFLTWGKRLPGTHSPFVTASRQEVDVSVSGARYYQNYHAVAVHRQFNTRLGLERSTHIQLSEKGRIYLREYPEHFRPSGIRRAGLVLNEGAPEQETIQLDCN